MTCFPAAAQSSTSPQLNEIVSRVQKAQSEIRNNPQYVALREYRLSDLKADTPSSRVLAEISYLPPGTKQFAIKQIQGSERGEKIVRKVLEHESQMASHSQNSEFTSANYDFTLLGHDTLGGHSCYVLQLRPKRESTDLLRGRAWVDSETFLIRRVEGQPPKNPSWWIKNLQLAIDYGRAGGLWLPLATRATADVRLLGTHVLTSQDVRVEAATETASIERHPVQSGSHGSAHHPVANAGVWVPQ